MPSYFGFAYYNPGLLPAAAGSATDLLEAAALALQGDLTVSALAPGGIWSYEAPAGTALAYVELDEQDLATGYESAGGDGSVPAIGLGTLTAHCLASSRRLARQLGRAVAAALRDPSLPYSEGTLLYLRPGSTTCGHDPEKSAAGTDVYRATQIFHRIEQSTL
jgi:hypothetical protein